MDKAPPLFVVRAPRGLDLDVIRSRLQAQLEGVRTVVVLPEGLELVSAEAHPAPDMLKLPVIDQAALLPETAPAPESTDALILAELKAIRELLEGADRPLLVEVA